MKLLENGIIPVYESKTGQAVNARDLHEFLEVGRDFTTWIKDRIEKYGFTENEDFVIFPESGENPGRPKMKYILSLDTAKEIAMVENNERGSEARKYFISIEKKFKQLVKPKCIEDVLIESLQEMKNIRLALTETKQEVQAIRDTIIVCPEDWRKYCVDALRKIAFITGMSYEEVNRISYEAFDLKGYDLNARLKNRRETAESYGVSRTKINLMNKLDCIGEDKRLINTYVNVVKEMSVKYKAA